MKVNLKYIVIGILVIVFLSVINCGTMSNLGLVQSMGSEASNREIERGNALANNGDDNGAIEAYTEAIRLSKSYALPYYNRGNAYLRKNELDLAIADYDQAIYLNGRYYEAFNNRGVAYRRKGELEKARADFEAALRINPNHASAKTNLQRLSTNDGEQSAQAILPQTPNVETDFRAEVTQDGRGVVIVGYIGNSRAVNIPTTIQSMPVREIGSSAFPDTVTSVVIPEGVTIIRNNAFIRRDANSGNYHSNQTLTTVIIPNSVTFIGESAFRNCTSLVSVNIPSGITIIRNSTFRNCSALTTIAIPDSVTVIEDYAFFSAGITSITLPARLTAIGERAFGQCRGLTSITIPNSVNSIGGGAFSLSGLRTINWPAKITSIQTFSTPYPYAETIGMFEACTNLQTVIIPEGITSIGANTFRGCSSLTSISLPSTIRSIGARAFQNCSSLTTINIPDNVTSIEFRQLSTRTYGEIFSGCRNLTLASQAALRRVGFTESF